MSKSWIFTTEGSISKIPSALSQGSSINEDEERTGTLLAALVWGGGRAS